MISILLVFGGALSGLFVVKAAGTTIAASIPLGLYKKNKDLEKVLHLGSNPGLSKELGVEDGFGPYQFNEEDVPPHMASLANKKLCLTQRELYKLFGIIRENKTMSELCSRNGISFEEFSKNSESIQVAETDYRELMLLSDRRLADPIIQQKLQENG